MQKLWSERAEERGLAFPNSRSGSCKFAALIARELFGGRLAGNEDHVFVVLDGQIIDLNIDQDDVKSLGSAAHHQDLLILLQPDYRDAFGSCVARSGKWAKIALEGDFLNHRQTKPENQVSEALEVAPAPAG